MNKLALRLGLCGGLLAFAGNGLIMFSRDPGFQQQTPQQVIQMSMVWFGFTALVCSVTGWGIWALTRAAEERRTELAAQAQARNQAAEARPVMLDVRVGDASDEGRGGAGANARRGGTVQPGGPASEEFPPEATAQAVRSALRDDIR